MATMDHVDDYSGLFQVQWVGGYSGPFVAIMGTLMAIVGRVATASHVEFFDTQVFTSWEVLESLSWLHWAILAIEGCVAIVGHIELPNNRASTS